MWQNRHLIQLTKHSLINDVGKNEYSLEKKVYTLYNKKWIIYKDPNVKIYM